MIDVNQKNSLTIWQECGDDYDYYPPEPAIKFTAYPDCIEIAQVDCDGKIQRILINNNSKNERQLIKALKQARRLSIEDEQSNQM